MNIETYPLQVLLTGLKKLTYDEVKFFCGESYFQTTHTRFQSGMLPHSIQFDKSQSDFLSSVFTLVTGEHSVEVALLKYKWEITTTSEKLLYRFVPNELSFNLFTTPANSHLIGRQILCDCFVFLWLLSIDNEDNFNYWGIDSKNTSLLLAKKSISEELSSLILTIENVKTLLICIPNANSYVDTTDGTIHESRHLIEVINGKYFKANNLPQYNKIKTLDLENRDLRATILQNGLVELQVIDRNNQVIPLKCNEEIISLLGNFRTDKADRRMLDKLCSIDENDSLMFRSLERNKLFLIDMFFENKKNVRLVFGYDIFKSRNYVKCLEFSLCTFGGIYFRPNINVELQSGYGQLKLSLEIPTSIRGEILSGQISFSSISRRLVFHNFHQLSMKFARFIEQQESKFKIKVTEFDHIKILFSHPNIYSFLKNLYSEISSDFLIQTVKESIYENVIKTQILVGKYDFSIKHFISHQSKMISIANFCNEWKPILNGINKGLVDVFSIKNIESALSNRRTQRQNELKLLNHVGIYITILFSTFEWKFKEQNLQKSKPLFIEELWQGILLLFSSKGESQGQFFENELISNKVKIIINDFIENILDLLDTDHEIRVVLDNEILSIKGLFAEQAKIIYFWLQQLTLLTKGDLLTKTNNKYLPPLWFKDSKAHLDEIPYSLFVNENEEMNPNTAKLQPYSLTNSEGQLPLPLTRWAKLPQHFPEISVTIAGHELEPINADQFKVNFELINPNNIDTQENGSNHHRIDWFDLNPKYFLKGIEISEVDAKKLTLEGVLEYQGRFYVLDKDDLPAHKALEIFWKRLQLNQQSSAKSNFNKKETEVLIQKHHVLELLALRRMGIEFNGPQEWEQICQYYDNLSQPRCQLDLGEKLNGMLKPYQLSGVQWLWDLFQLRVGGILADDMGLGKTAQALSFLQYGKTKNQIMKVLVVVPVSLTFNWVAEAQKFTPNLNISVFDPKQSDTLKSDIIVCTYSLLSLHHQLFETNVFDVIIFDEAQYLKNIGTNRFKSSEFLKAKFKVALTGTPIENNLSELYSLFHLVVPGLLGSRQNFQKNYVKPEILPRESIEFLKAKLKPLILRRRKQDLSLELPEKTENQIYVDFSEKQKELYRNTALSWSQKVNESIQQKGTNQSKIYMLTALLRLRQVCSDPAALPSVIYTEIPPKISILIDMLEEITEEGHSAIVFTQFMSTFTRLKELLNKHHIQFFEMHGGTPRKEREILLKNFSSDTSANGSVLLMTLKTGGVGLNLTKASYVFHLEPWWNPAVENQATDRVHRLGQNKNVTVYRMIMRESVEEKVEILKSRKSQLFNNIFGDDYFSLESANENINENNPSQTAITKEDFDVLIQ